MRRLADRVALVTGAGGPMGRAVAAKVATEGAHVAIADISAKRLQEGEAEIASKAPPGARVVGLRADVTAKAEADALADLALREFGKVDILINVVGGIKSTSLYTPFLELPEERWDATFALNLKPGFHLIKRLAPGMLARRYGKIVNVASVVLGGEAGQADYASAKAAVAALTRSLAEEFAPHVNVNCIAPGLIDTSVVRRLPEDELRKFVGKSALKRLGRPEEIADVAVWLASDESSFLTGEIIAVSGGNHPAL